MLYIKFDTETDKQSSETDTHSSRKKQTSLNAIGTEWSDGAETGKRSPENVELVPKTEHEKMKKGLKEFFIEHHAFQNRKGCEGIRGWKFFTLCYRHSLFTLSQKIHKSASDKKTTS